MLFVGVFIFYAAWVTVRVMDMAEIHSFHGLGVTRSTFYLILIGYM